MITKQYIKDFENLGLGMFVHFGIYSVLGICGISRMRTGRRMRFTA